MFEPLCVSLDTIEGSAQLGFLLGIGRGERHHVRAAAGSGRLVDLSLEELSRFFTVRQHVHTITQHRRAGAFQRPPQPHARRLATPRQRDHQHQPG